MDIKNTILIILIAGATSFVLQKVSQGNSLNALSSNDKDSVYARVMKSGTIKCGYIPYAPAMMVDPNTGEKSGIFFDFMNEVGKRLSLKVEWVQESGWGSYINDLKTDRFDMLCSTVWTNSARAREANHIKPLYYSAITAWVRSDDNRFNENLDILNSKEHSIATIDGEAAAAMANINFPNAKLFSLPESASISKIALSVSTGKADATFLESYVAQNFLKNNPNSLKQIGGNLRLYGNAMFLKKGEHDLRLMVDAAVEEILNSDFLPNLFDTYNVPQGSYVMPLAPNQTN